MIEPASVSATIALVQKVISLGKKATNLDYEEALLAAREALFIQGQENLNLKEEKLSLEQKLKLLKAADDLAKYVKFNGAAYWLVKDNKHEGPNCTACWMDRNKLIRLDFVNMGSIFMKCPSCKATYGHSVKRKYNDEN